MSTQYYKAVVGSHLLGIGRHRTEIDREAFEVYQEGKWVNSRTLVDALGLGGDSPYIPITEKEANKLKKDIDEIVKEKGRYIAA
jgi:hypothetical protein